MRITPIAAAALTCLLSTTAYAQSNTAVGTGISGAEANSASGAIAVNRGNGSSSSSLTVNNPANQNVNSTVSGTTTSNINSNGTTRVVSSGTTTVKTAPSMVAPGLAAAGLETCLGSASGTVSAVGFGIGGGSTYVDEGCQARLDARTLASWGLQGAAVSRICQREQVWRSMPDVCMRHWPAGTAYPAWVVVAPPGYGANITMSANSGVVRVVNGKTGIEGDCLNYSYGAQKCYHWLGDKPRKKQTVANVQAPHRIVVKPQKERPKEEPKVEPAKVEPPKT
jgi:hypothetical protein